MLQDSSPGVCRISDGSCAAVAHSPNHHLKNNFHDLHQSLHPSGDQQSGDILMDTWVNKEHEENSASRLIYLLKLEGRAPREPAAALGAHRPLPHSPDPKQAPSTQHPARAGPAQQERVCSRVGSLTSPRQGCKLWGLLAFETG